MELAKLKRLGELKEEELHQLRVIDNKILEKIRATFVDFHLFFTEKGFELKKDSEIGQLSALYKKLSIALTNRKWNYANAEVLFDLTVNLPKESKTTIKMKVPLLPSEYKNIASSLAGAVETAQKDADALTQSLQKMDAESWPYEIISPKDEQKKYATFQTLLTELFK